MDIPKGQPLGVILTVLFIISHLYDVLFACASVCVHECSGFVHVCEGAWEGRDQTPVAFFKNYPSCFLS